MVNRDGAPDRNRRTRRRRPDGDRHIDTIDTIIKEDPAMTATLDPAVTPSPTPEPPAPVVTLRRRTIDRLLVGLGAVVAIVLFVAAGLLTWGSNFAEDYVRDELSSQQIFFPPAEALTEEGRDDLLDFAGQQVVNGDQAEAYASFIDGHLEGIADGLTYAELGGPQSEARAALAEAQESGAPDDEIAALQDDLNAINGQRDSLFRGETLRGLLLSTYAWSTIGQIAGIAAIVAFVAGAVMVVLVVAGIVHLTRTPRTT
jgi:hypothetical protein